MDPLKKVAPVKKIAASPFLKKFLGLEIWPYWVAIIAIVALAVLLVFLIKRRRAKKVEPPIEDTKEKPFPPSTLRNIWKEFLAQIPGEFRRSITMYEHFVVLGESGVGKSSLIDACTDWQGQARQFYPSYTTDPLLQTYLGSRVVVQEIPPALLNDSSKPVLTAFRRLWRPLFRRREPTVVVVLNSTALQFDTIESLKKHAQMIRGKINIISRLRKKPVKVCIALTHMDQQQGFLEFSRFLHENNIPLDIRFTSKKDLQNLSACLEKYEDYLSYGLTNLPAKDYLQVISFLRQASDLFSRVSVFARILQSPDPLSPEPEVIRLSLTSEKEGDRVISNPFVSAFGDEDLRRIRPLRKHQIAAAALVVFGVAYLLSGYLYERHLLNKTDLQMFRMQASPPALADYDSEMHRLFLDFSMSLKKDPLLAFLPNFFPNFHQRINNRLVRSIRRFYLIPEIQRLSILGRGEEVQERTLYLLSLMCATNTNQLGKLILQNLREESEEWSKRLGLPKLLIEDYVTNNTDLREVALDLSKLNLARLQGRGQPPDLLKTLLYFRELNKAYQKPWITKSTLQKLQQEAGLGLELLAKLERYNLYAKFSELLDSELKVLKPAVDIDFIWTQRKRSKINRDVIRQFLTFFRGLTIDYPPVEELSLDRLMENTKAMMTLFARQPEGGETLKFDIAGEVFEYDEKKWKELTINSRITLSLRDFIAANKRGDGLLFFDLDEGFEDIQMNPTNEGRFLFLGKGKVDGRFTREAFEEKVKPALMGLPEFLDSLRIEQSEKNRFRNLVFRETQAFADKYLDEWRNYYWHFDVQAQSLEELRYVLTQMQLPSSPFQNFLTVIKENTVLDLGDNPFFSPLEAKLKSFAFIGRVMEKRKDSVPELENYRAILAQMQRDLESKEAPKQAEAADDSSLFEGQLSPLGRFFLTILRGEEDSYLTLAEKWIKNVGISGEYKHLFLEPFRQAYQLGRPEVKEKVNNLWSELYLSDIQPLVSKFPFDQKAEVAISPSDLATVLHPQQGTFWKAFKIFLSPVCREKGGVFTERKCALGSLGLSKDLLNTVNNLSKIGRTLWDEKGVPRPLVLYFEPFPLPTLTDKEMVAVLSYLQSGNSSVFGFNQRPAWQKFELEWWKEHPAAVGFEFRTSPDTPSIYKAIAVPKSNWSFLRLLTLGKVVDSDVLAWKVERPEYPSDYLTVKFATKSDPWAVFKLVE